MIRMDFLAKARVEFSCEGKSLCLRDEKVREEEILCTTVLAKELDHRRIKVCNEANNGQGGSRRCPGRQTSPPKRQLGETTEQRKKAEQLNELTTVANKARPHKGKVNHRRSKENTAKMKEAPA